MVRFLQRLVEIYNYINYDLSDPRTRHHYVLTDPLFVILLLVAYYKLTTKWGPKFMEKREPFKLKKILIVYNVLQILASAYISLEGIRVALWNGSYSVLCQPISSEQSPIEMNIITLTKYYYYQKLADLLDTIFFVMRKKRKQVSSLHLYHHMIMIFTCFLGLKYVNGGHGIHLGIINCIVHVVMYTYYLITVIFPEHKKTLWWKKYITIMQLAQFIILFFLFFYVIVDSNCTYPLWASVLFLTQNSIMIHLFSVFYYNEYILKNKQQ